MKKILAFIIMAAFTLPALAVDKAPTKKVIKKHKKVEGTTVPVAAPKKVPAKKK